MSTIRTLVVDDEKLAREALKMELAAFPEIEIVGECENGFTAVKAIQEQKPDLVFLDIQMPKLDGFDVIELIGGAGPAVVFVTAHDEYALQAFEARAVDYLLKPVRPERLRQCMERLRRVIGGPAAAPPPQLVEDHQGRQAPLTRILVRLGSDVHIVPVGEISHIEAQDDYVRIFTAGRSLLKNERLSRLEELLDPHQFCRIHRSYLLNVAFLKKIEPWSKDSRIAKLKSGESLPVSRQGFARLKELL